MNWGGKSKLVFSVYQPFMLCVQSTAGANIVSLKDAMSICQCCLTKAAPIMWNSSASMLSF